MPLRELLVPTDGSDTTLHAAEHVLELAATIDATVHVLSVINDILLGPDVRSVLSTENLDQPAHDAVAVVVAAAERYDVPLVHIYVEHGALTDTITTAIDDHAIDAIVIDTTGCRGVKRIFVGGVAEQIVRIAPVSVITVADK